MFPGSSECCSDSDCKDYRGKLSYTQSGMECVRWDSTDYEHTPCRYVFYIYLSLWSAHVYFACAYDSWMTIKQNKHWQLSLALY